jgi:hypothetical protein
MLNLLTNLSDCGLTSDAAVIANLVHAVINIIKIFIPIVLIIFGMLDLGKAVMSNDEKTMKEAQGKLIKRFIYAVLVFLVVTLVQVVLGFVDKANQGTTGDAKTCISCFVKGADENGNCNS